MAVCHQYDSTYFHTRYADNQLLCSLCGTKRNYAFLLRASTLNLAVGRPAFAISPKEYTRNYLRRSKIQNFAWGACPQTPLARGPTGQTLNQEESLVKFLSAQPHQAFVLQTQQQRI